MNFIMDTVRQLSQLIPPQLPQLQLVNAPDIAAVKPLAQIAGANPTKLLESVGVLEKDQQVIREVAGSAGQLITACGFDLIKLGGELLSKAAPIALGLLLPNPAAHMAARTALQALAMEYLARAIQRGVQLAGELAMIAQPLLEIAARPVVSAVSDGVGELKALQAASQPETTRIAGPTSATSHVSNAQVMDDASGSNSVDALPGSSTGSSTGGSAAGEKAVDTAMSMVGTPYAWGGTSPSGFDCSGLTQYAYREAGIELPRLAEEQTVGRPVSANELVKGDLVVWDGHVAMYAGDGQIVEAGDPVQVNPLRTSNMGMEFKGFWRPTG